MNNQEITDYLNDIVQRDKELIYPNGWFSCSISMAQDILALLKKQEAKAGHWIYKEYDDMFMCSCCEKYSIRNDYPYCHWCGAKMEGR